MAWRNAPKGLSMLIAPILLLLVQSSSIGDFKIVEKRWAAEVDEDEEVQVTATLQSGSATLVIGCDHHISSSLTATLYAGRQLVANRPPIAGIQRFGEPPNQTAQIAFTYQVTGQPMEAHTGTLKSQAVQFKGAWQLASSLAKGNHVVFKLPGLPPQAGQPPLESEVAFSTRDSRRAMERVAKACNDRVLQAALAQD